MRILFVLITIAFVVSACGTNGPVAGATHSPSTDVVLLGVAQKTGLKAPISVLAMAVDLEKIVVARRDLTATPVLRVRQIIGGSPHDEMMAYYARNGRFAPYQMQRLMAAGLPAQKALVVRLEADNIERLPVRRQALIDQNGRLIADRERRTFVTRRMTQLSATLLDLGNGRQIWTRQYRVSPETESASEHYDGESFAGSVAAAVANTLVQSIRDTQYPPPPALERNVQALLQEVAVKAPLN